MNARPPYALNVPARRDVSPTLSRVIEATGTPITSDAGQPWGLCAPVEFVDIRDGDTVIIRLARSLSSQNHLEWAIRVAGVNSPEKNTAAGTAAASFTRELLAEQSDLALFVPLPKNPARLLSALSFDRIPADIFLDNDTRLAAALLTAGHAVKWP